MKTLKTSLLITAFAFVTSPLLAAPGQGGPNGAGAQSNPQQVQQRMQQQQQVQQRSEQMLHNNLQLQQRNQNRIQNQDGQGSQIQNRNQVREPATEE